MDVRVPHRTSVIIVSSSCLFHRVIRIRIRIPAADVLSLLVNKSFTTQHKEVRG
jgi:hypothetical protein